MPRATSHLMAMPCLVSWKSVFPRETLAFDMRNTAWHHTCKNEVIIEQYCNLFMPAIIAINMQMRITL